MIGRPPGPRMGQRLSLASNRNSSYYNIYVMNADGTGTTRLTTTSGDDRTPAWSPDGSKIVFCSGRGGAYFYQIYVMNSDGTGQTQLTTDSQYSSWNHYPAWSPDGSKIIFSSGRNDSIDSLYVMNADGTGQTQLTYPPSDDGMPAWGVQPVATANPDRDGGIPSGSGVLSQDGQRRSWNPSTDRYLAWDNAAGRSPDRRDWNADGRDETAVYGPAPGSISRWTTAAPGIPRPIAISPGIMHGGDLPIAGTGMQTAEPRPVWYRPGAGFYLKMDNGSTWNLSADNISLGTMLPLTDQSPVIGILDGRTETGVYRAEAALSQNGQWQHLESID